MTRRSSTRLLIFTLLVLLLLAPEQCLTKRRKGGADSGRIFEARPGMGKIDASSGPSSGEEEKAADAEKKDGNVTASRAESMTTEHPSTEIINATTPIPMRQDPKEAGEVVRLLSEGDPPKASSGRPSASQRQPSRDDVGLVPATLAGEQADSVLWIDSTFKAEDAGMNISGIAECRAWERYWENNSTMFSSGGGGLPITFYLASTNDSLASAVEEPSSTAATKSKKPAAKKGERIRLVEYELIDEKARLEELGLSPLLLDDEKVEEQNKVGVLFKELCGQHEREFLYKTAEEAKEIGIDAGSAICNPFKEQLHPSVETLADLSTLLNALVAKRELSNKSLLSREEAVKNQSAVSSPNATSSKAIAKREIKPQLRKEAKDLKTITSADKVDSPSAVAAAAADEKSVGVAGEEVDEEWLENVAVPKQILDTETPKTANETGTGEHLVAGPSSADEADQHVWVQIDATDETAPVLYLLSASSAAALNLTLPEHHFHRYERVGLFLAGVCAEYIPTAVESFDASEFEGVDIEGPIGVNISALEAAGVNLTELAEKLRNDIEVDDILQRVRNESSARELGGSYILPVLNKNQYDAYSPPIVFQGSAVVVRLGIYIESMSNFQTSTMDYDMDIYLLMAWRDARLVTPYKRPILVKEEEILEKLWRPDPYFDAKEAEFHEVTFLNFLMRIYTDGLVLYETRIKLKPACNLLLCKYPHDKQTCELQVKSFAYPLETVRFEWFTRKEDAMDKNPEVKLPELYIDRYEPTQCHNRTRRSGSFSCLRAVFRLKRDVGFHIAQTYIPTSLALMFSWVGVWLPEEFMEGRIGVAITVLLTLSTESAGAREHLPSVSYLKAIDLWFGYITGFVFFTLLQTLFVIGFDKRANQLRKWANKRRVEMSQEARDALFEKAERYHKSGRYLDNFCRVSYPLCFVLFLIAYYFVFTEGRQDDCIAAR